MTQKVQIPPSANDATAVQSRAGPWTPATGYHASAGWEIDPKLLGQIAREIREHGDRTQLLDIEQIESVLLALVRMGLAPNHRRSNPIDALRSRRNLAHFAAVLGVGLPEPHIGLCTHVATRLYDHDLTLIGFADDEDRSGIDRTDDIEATLAACQQILDEVPKAGLTLYFNDQIPVDPLDGTLIGGRLKVVWENSRWNEDDPLYLAVPTQTDGETRRTL